ncbi:MAG: DsbA family protein [Myxococcota bacterium]
MTLSAALESAPLTVLLDVRHPQAYLALGPTLELAAATHLTPNWLPIAAQTLRAPGNAAPTDDRGARHRRYRAEAIAREIETYAEAQELEIRGYYRDGAPEGAHLAWLWVRHHYPERLVEFLQAVFRGYWKQELEIASPSQLAPVLDELGLPSAAFLDWVAGEGADALRQLGEELRGHGLQQVPMFVVEDEVFWGRQHLPMIRWILEGRRGPGPI